MYADCYFEYYLIFYSTSIFFLDMVFNISQRMTSWKLTIDIVDSKFEKWDGKTTFVKLSMFI